MNNVRSRPLGKQSAILTRAQLARQRGTFERMSALFVLFFSFAGSVAALSGGWRALVHAPRLAPILGGLGVQLALTAVEWWYGGGVGPWRYRLALLIDAALTTIGYGPLVVPWIAPYIAARVAGELAGVLAWTIIGIASVVIAWYPEVTLIDE